MAPVRVVRAFRIPITAIITALALSGCMRTTGPVAVGPQGDLDSMAYGQPNTPPPQAVPADSRCPNRALPPAFISAPRPQAAPALAPTPPASAAPLPAPYHPAHH